MTMLRCLVRQEKGSSLVLVAVGMAALLGVAALAIDTGQLYLERAQLNAAVDAAALAGAAALKDGYSAAYTTAAVYAEENGLTAGEYVIEIDADSAAVSVTAGRQILLSFARVFGMQHAEVKAGAAAGIGAVSAITGAAPLAVEQQQFQFGMLYTLKYGAGDGTTGNFGALALGGTGTRNYINNLVNGYQGKLRIGDYVSTEPGNMSNPTVTAVNQIISSCHHVPTCSVEHFEPDCPRILKVVVVDSLDLDGRDTAQIVGFAAFLVEGVGGQGNKCEVYGRFLRMIIQGENQPGTGFGLYSVRLLK